MKYKLSELMDVIGGGTPKTSKLEYWNGDIPWISVKDFNNDCRYVYQTEKSITKDGLEKSSTKLLDKGDMIISARGTVGEIASIPYPMAFNQSCYGLRAKSDLVTSDFLYYLIKHNVVILKKQTHGSVFDTITRDTFAGIEVDIPYLDEQRSIASLLSDLDAKVELNIKINENLAEQAQGVLYHFMDQYQHQLIPLSDIANVVDCLHSKKPAAIEDSTHQLIQLDNIRDDGFLDMSACRYMISQADYENWTRKCEIIEGDCVITNVGRIGAVSQAPYGTKAAMGRNMTCIRLKSGLQLRAYFITVLLSNHMRRQIQHNTDEGTIMGALNVKNIPKLLFPIFDAPIISDLESILYPLRKQIEYNNLQNQNLAQLRDVLLPRLMSGELDVSGLDL